MYTRHIHTLTHPLLYMVCIDTATGWVLPSRSKCVLKAVWSSQDKLHDSLGARAWGPSESII